MTSTISVYQASLASFGTPVLAGTKMVKPGSVTLQGNNGAWVTIATDQYLIGLQTGLIRQSTLDDDGAAVDWSTYTSFRATYTVLSAGTETTYTNELVTGTTANDGLFVLTEAAAVPIGADGELIADFLRWVAVNGPVYATAGYIAGILRVIGTLYAGTGDAITLDSNGITVLSQTPGATPYIRWLTSGAVKTGDIQSRTDAPDLQGDIVVKGYGPDGTNHYGVAALAAQDNDGTTSALWLSSDGQLQHKILNDTNMGLIPALYARDYGGTTVANTSVETTIFTKTIKAKSLGANGLMQLTIGGEFKNNVTNTITFKVKFGGTTMNTLTMDVSAFGTGSGGYVIRDLFIMPNNASSEQSVADAVINVGANARSASDYGTAAKDTTSDQDLVVTAKWTTADTSSGIYTKCGVLMLSNAR